jgi:hypothetical protein
MVDDPAAVKAEWAGPTVDGLERSTRGAGVSAVRGVYGTHTDRRWRRRGATCPLAHGLAHGRLSMAIRWHGGSWLTVPPA